MRIPLKRYSERIKIKKLLFLAIILMMAGHFVATSSEPYSRNKSRYYFLEGARQSALGNKAEAYAYFQKAYELDPTYSDASEAYGSQRLFLRVDTLMSDFEIAKSLDMLREYVDNYPKDIFSGQRYSYFTARLDTLEESIRVLERMRDLLPGETYLLPNLAEVYMMAGKTGDAISTLDRYEKIEGKSQPVTVKKISYMLAAGDTVRALGEATALIDNQPRNVPALILKGNLFEVVNQPDSTIYYYNRAKELEPENGSVKMALASYYKERGDSVNFDREIYEGLLSEDFEFDEKMAILADYLQILQDEQGEATRGDYLFNVLINQYPHEARLRDLAARFRASRGDFKRASEEIGYAIDMDPTNEMFRQQNMSYLISAEMYDEAKGAYRDAINHLEVPDLMKWLYASANIETGNFEEAEKIYAELIRKYDASLPLTDPVDNLPLRNSLDYDSLMLLGSYYTMLGDLYYRLGELAKTYAAYDNSLYFFPANPMTLNNYAYFLAENDGDLDKAMTMSRKALDEDDTNPTFLDTYAWILFKRKEYKDALEYQTLAIDFAETNYEPSAELYHHMGDILFMNHNPEEALEYWQKALELEPDNALLKKKVEHKTFFFE